MLSTGAQFSNVSLTARGSLRVALYAKPLAHTILAFVFEGEWELACSQASHKTSAQFWHFPRSTGSEEVSVARQASGPICILRAVTFINQVWEMGGGKPSHWPN